MWGKVAQKTATVKVVWNLYLKLAVSVIICDVSCPAGIQTKSSAVSLRL
jgi:hypothetical protein